MADEPQKAAAVAEPGKSQEQASGIDHKSKNGDSAKNDEPQHATDPKGENAAPGTTKSDRAHKDAHDKKSKDTSKPLPSLERFQVTPFSEKHAPGKHAMTKHQSNVKTDYGALPASRDPAEIRKQVEFYFSDANLSYDDYMRKLTGGPANDPVPLATLHSFKRMRRFQPVGAVVAALRASAALAVVDAKGNPAPEPVDNEAEEEEGFGAAAHIVRRVAWAPPATADGEGAAALADPGLPRSVYAKGFGAETATTQFDVEAYFAPFGPVNMVRLRRKAGDRTFKGSAFVEFATEELARRFLDSKERPRWAGDVELKVMGKREYLEKQEEDIKAGKIGEDKKSKYKMYEPRKDGDRFAGKRDGGKHGGGRGGRRDERSGRDRRDGRDNRNGRGGRGGRGGRDDDDWKARRDDFQKGLKDDEARFAPPHAPKPRPERLTPPPPGPTPGPPATRRRSAAGTRAEPTTRGAARPRGPGSTRRSPLPPPARRRRSEARRRETGGGEEAGGRRQRAGVGRGGGRGRGRGC
jgi:lupus La protein